MADFENNHINEIRKSTYDNYKVAYLQKKIYVIQFSGQFKLNTQSRKYSSFSFAFEFLKYNQCQLSLKGV